MKSCIYKGTVGHQRRGKSANKFRYSLFLVYLDLDELSSLFSRYWFWSADKPAIARFRRSDHYGDKDTSLRTSIAELVEQRTGKTVDGPIRLLTHLSYFGYCFNPLSVYYCFDKDEQLQYVVLEVSNMPWGEQHCYVLSAANMISERYHHYRFAKDFHVSPFLPMDMEYICRLTEPTEKLFLSLDNHRDGEKVFSSQVALEKRAITGRNMAKTLLADPLMTLRVSTLIHWQAARLWFKRARFYGHPGNKTYDANQAIKNKHDQRASAQ